MPMDPEIFCSGSCVFSIQVNGETLGHNLNLHTRAIN